MKKIIFLTLLILIFIANFLYLNQKIQIYIEAYRLQGNYRKYNDLVDKRDYLMHNFTKEISLVKINQWAQQENFSLVDKERTLVLGAESKKKAVSNKIVLFFNRFLKSPATAQAALAEEER